MNINEIGEFGFIAKIKELFVKNMPEGVLGIDDDCAVIPKDGNQSLLVTTDALIENTHFIRHAIDPKDLGYKTAAVNLSDIAAMGGVPKYFWLSIAIPDDLESDWLDKYLAGLRGILDQYQVFLLGGDTVYSSHDIFISATVMGEAENNNVKYRSKAQIGDVICVTGNLGDSAAGLNCLFHGFPGKETISKLIARHYRPVPQISEGLFLAQQSGVHSMIDLSDGLNSDIERIMASSNCGADIYLDVLPTSAELIKMAPSLGFDILELAAVGGEDYVLLATVDSDHFSKIADNFKKKFARPLVKIGEITAHSRKLRYFSQEKPYPYKLKMNGFSHFNEFYLKTPKSYPN
jgi:thiamine-monophosphate kinase